MKVTDAMVMRAARASFEQIENHNYVVPQLRRALEAALEGVGGDMPEMLALCEHKDARIDELEDKLERVRKWASFFMPEGIGAAELWAIIDTEED